MGIRYLTLYAFSTENWNRPPEEVKALMNLLDSYLKNCIQTAKKNNMAVRILGDISRLDERMQERSENLRRVRRTMTDCISRSLSITEVG